MKIIVNNYKNIINFEVDIIDQKFNIIYGLSGSGKSAISEVFNEPLEKNKSLFANGDIYGSIDPLKQHTPIISIFNEKSLEKVLLEHEEDLYTGVILIDNETEVLKQKQQLELLLKDLDNKLESYKSKNEIYSGLQKKLKININKNNNLTKTSSLTKLRSMIKTKADTNIFNHLMNLESEYFEWLLKGTTFEQYNHDKCPFCEKKLNNKIKRKLKNYKSYEKNLISSYKFKVDEAQYLDTLSKYTPKEIDKTEKEMLKIARANKGYDIIRDFVKTVSKDSVESLNKIEVPSETFKYYPELKASVSIINRNIKTLSEKYNKALALANATLSRKVGKVNKLLERFGLQYEISATYKNGAVSNYKIYHKNDFQKLERLSGLSYGEKRIFALIMFILEAEKNSEADLFIFDDPVSSFDESRRYSFMNLIVESLKGKTILLLSHEQSIAKYGVIDKNNSKSKFGKILYLENYDGNPMISEIQREHFDNIESHILHRLKSCPNYIQKIINLRLFYEKKPSRNKKIYNYLSNILHGNYKKIIKDEENEKAILDLIKADTMVKLDPFEKSYYVDIDLSDFSYFEKSFILREQISLKKNPGLYKELSYYIHLNGRELISLDPYRFTCMTKYVYDNLSSMDQVVNIH